ncbi:hypothetical protein HMPREF0201_03970 [Cedecea davisae DSM 4568]|uniref:Uncharacterized protein n=1 Tax=Cedecea davisae DSM 4568 TaxID=566551 RepID=S3IIU0_9ENTR|nr:hypothetical protein HMPREF0201_03970 [Cedecea davisae DSM 4568]
MIYVLAVTEFRLNLPKEGAMIARIFLSTTGRFDVHSQFPRIFRDSARPCSYFLPKSLAHHAVRATYARCRTTVKSGLTWFY